MADKLLKTLVGGGGGAIQSINIGGLIPLGTPAGELLVITPPAGKKIVLTALMPVTTVQDNININVGGRDVYTGTISDGVNQYYLTIAQAASATTNEYSAAGVVNSIQGGVDESITVTKVALATSAFIFYSYLIID